MGNLGKKTNPYRNVAVDTPLAAWLRENNRSAYWLSIEVGVQGDTIREWIEGRRMPSLVMAYKLDELTKGKCPPACWLGTPAGKWEYENAGNKLKGEEMRERNKQYGRAAYLKRKAKYGSAAAGAPRGAQVGVLRKVQ